MTVRDKWVIAAVAVASAAMMPVPAWAGLLGAGNTVTALFYLDPLNPSVSNPAITETEGSNVSLIAPANFAEGADDLSTIAINDTQITIVNNASTGTTYCYNGVSIGAACTDTLTGFEFKFTGENILGASIDPASSSGFTPATFGSHQGLDLVNGDDLLLDLTGADPAQNGQLIIDLSFTATTPPTGSPEPAALTVFGVALGGMIAVRRRRWHPT